jgi:hypothetical protein
MSDFFLSSGQYLSHGGFSRFLRILAAKVVALLPPLMLVCVGCNQ